MTLTPLPADLRIGDDPVKAVYAGDTKVWPVLVYGPDQHVVAFDANAGGNSGFDLTLGMRFTPVADGRVTQLGTLIAGGTHTFSLWKTATGEKIASVTNTYSGGGDWRYETLPTPVNVVGGTSYTVSFSADYAAYGYVVSWTPPNPSTFTSLSACGAPGSDVFPGGPSNPYGITSEHFHADAVYQKLT